MIRYSKLTALAAAVIAVGPAFAAMTMDANLELDNDYRNKITPNAASEQLPATPAAAAGRPRSLSQGGRVEFNVAGKAGDANGFVAGRGTLLIKRDGTTGVDDMWGQIGTGMVDVKLGRFEAADLFPAGKDVVVEDGANAAGGARTNLLRGRTGPSTFQSAFHGALTVNPGGGVSVEVGVVQTKLGYKGIRPVVTFNAGVVTVKGGFETGKDAASGQKFTGLGATVGGALEGIGFNVNLATVKLKANGPLQPEIKSNSFGANATFGPAGVGLVIDRDKAEVVGGRKHQDMVVYAAYSIPLFNTGATLTPALSYQTGKRTVGGVADKYKAATAARVRLNYTF